MKQIIFTLSAFALSALFFSCSKKGTNSNKSLSGITAQQLIQKVLIDDVEHDFKISTTSSLGISVFNTPNISNTATFIQAYSKRLQREGSLSVNALDIPYTNSNTFFAQSDSANNLQNILGQPTQYVFNSVSAEMPSFSNTFTPKQTTLFNVVNLSNYKIDRYSDLQLNIETHYPNSAEEALIVLEGEDKINGIYVTEQISLLESASELTIPAGVLSKFANCSALNIYYSSGKNFTINVEDKIVEFVDINFSWSTIYFK